MITSHGLTVDHTEHGPAQGRPLVLLAGFLAPATSWRHQVPALAAAGYRVFAVDLPGHGTAGPQPDGTGMDERADALAEFLSAPGLRGVTLIGGSMGGNTIWAYLSRYSADRLRSIVIVDQTPKMLNTPDWPHGYYGYEPGNAETFFANGIPRTGHGTPVWRRGKRLLRLLQAMGGAPRLPLTAADRALLQDHARRDWRETLRDNDIPALFVAGEESELWPCTHAAASAALMPRGRAAIIAKAGHATNVEQPEAFNRGVLSFLTDPGVP
ncbi:alpha/beta hydrolase [Amycolatopsis acidicola]|uniref:Alpha/beta hydrolase n=1 Tax=Amycolatopsis acidicola TaxID=2596893 RepID=A0A5N0UZ04_9PSEU|nr:alpha/beta hydrolase [Amycolatopsis acidicola]KAA9157923.1 alpha/beta hydrolase [Amycolatopsis acidicola]